MKITSLAGALALIVIVLGGCPEDGIQLSLFANPEAGGTVQVSPQQDSYAAGTLVTLTATPAQDWRFARWEGVVASPLLATTTIAMDRSETVIAVFEPVLKQGFQLNVETSPTCFANVTTVPADDPDTGLYAPGTVVTLGLEPMCCEVGQGEFVRWEGGVVDPTAEETTCIMDSDKTIQAVFRPEGVEDRLLVLNAEPPIGGTVRITNPTKNPDQDIFFEGDRATLKAEPASGYHFAFWVGDVADLSSSDTTVTVLKDTTLTGVFVPNTDKPWYEYGYLFLPISPDDPLVAEIQSKFPNIILGTDAVDAALIMPGSVMDMALTPEQLDGLRQVYEAGLPIVMFYVTEEQLAALEALLGIPSMGSGDPSTLYAYYGLNKEPEGRNWRIEGYYPLLAEEGNIELDCDPSSTETECVEWREDAVSRIAAWIHEAGHRADVLPPSSKIAEVFKSVAGATFEKAADWTSYATTDSLQTTVTYTFSDGTSSYFTVLTTPYTCHSLSSGFDYLYMYQQGTFNPSGGCYKQDKKARAVTNYEVWTKAANYALNPQVTMIEPSPTTTIGEETVTSSMSWSIGDSVGFASGGGQAVISAGLSISRMESYPIPQVTVLQDSRDFNVAYWKYQMKNPELSKCENHLCCFSNFAFNTLAVVHQWIWVIQPSVRATLPQGLPVDASFKAKISYLVSTDCNIFGCACNIKESAAYYPEKTATFTVPWAPIP